MMDIYDLIVSRRTIRKFAQKEINAADLMRYINAARIAPSAANLQPLKYVIVKGDEMRAKVFSTLKWAGYLAPEYNPKDNERPMAYIVVCCDANIRTNGYDMDVGAAVENIILSALNDGIGSCWLGSVDRPLLQEILQLDDSAVISCVLALGYPAESPEEITLAENKDIKYYLNENNTLCVPKRPLEDVVIKSI